ncbi:hypothetical protein HN385_03640 [archaeon]|nr:hypothetical protein [archaeon]MBT3451702.1 hypothetical protein [archaeon]MBT6869790.1 hypothetical protein [archaeon]MBT7192745.1 hypothetical protein [archaeon]MBT7380770.1 hypothetical protein [archaeon]
MIRKKSLESSGMVLCDFGDKAVDQIMRDTETDIRTRKQALKDGFGMMNAQENIVPNSADHIAHEMFYDPSDPGMKYGGPLSSAMSSDERVTELIKKNYKVCDEKIKGLRVIRYDADLEIYSINVQKTIEETLKRDLEVDQTNLNTMLETEGLINQELLYGLNVLTINANQEKIYSLARDDELIKKIERLKESLPNNYTLNKEFLVDLGN